MSDSPKQLIMALEKECEIYKSYLDLVKEKQEALVENDSKRIENITIDEQAMVKFMKKINDIRTAIVGNILCENHVSYVENITELIKYIKSPEQDKILKLKNKLGGLLKEIDHVNQLNERLINHSLEYLEFQMNLLTSKEQEGYMYAKEKEDASYMPRMFDAKI